jgi:hypothetical protein
MHMACELKPSTNGTFLVDVAERHSSRVAHSLEEALLREVAAIARSVGAKISNCNIADASHTTAAGECAGEDRVNLAGQAASKNVCSSFSLSVVTKASV